MLSTDNRRDREVLHSFFSLNQAVFAPNNQDASICSYEDDIGAFPKSQSPVAMDTTVSGP
jgi:hypothetical protein